MKKLPLVAIAGFVLGGGTAHAQALAPASVANSIVTIFTTAGPPAIHATIWLRGDGTDSFLHYSQSDFVLGAPLPSDGTYSYAVSPTNPTLGVLTMSGSNGSYISEVSDLVFTSPSGGNYGLINPSGNSFTFSPAIAANSAVNLSNLSWVNPAQSATTGFVISGPTPRWVLIRAVGPGLLNLGVANALAAPNLRLFAGGNVIGTYGPWADGSYLSAVAAGLQAVFAMVGAFPLNPVSNDCAAFLQLAPGAYTMVCSSQNGSGQVLSEMYVLPY